MAKQKAVNIRHRGALRHDLAYLTMLLPGLVFMFAFNYLPMPAIIMAFKRYALAPVPKDFPIQNRFIYSLFVQNEWVGLQNFEFLIRTPSMGSYVRNTVGYNLIFMLIGTVVAVSIAIAVNELRNRLAAKFYHTVIFLPYFLSWIIVSYVVYAFLSTNGIMNNLLVKFGGATLDWYRTPRYWPFILTFANVWKHSGYSSILYLSTLTGFDQEVYESAAIDGASKWQQIRYITVPLLLPMIVLLQILAVGRIFGSEFDMFYSLPNGSGPLASVTTTIDVFVYNALRTGAQLGLPAAASFFQAVVGFVLVLLTNFIVRRFDADMALF